MALLYIFLIIIAIGILLLSNPGKFILSVTGIGIILCLGIGLIIIFISWIAGDEVGKKLIVLAIFSIAMGSLGALGNKLGNKGIFKTIDSKLIDKYGTILALVLAFGIIAIGAIIVGFLNK